MSQELMDSYEFGRALSKRIKKWRILTEKNIAPLGITLGEFGILVSLSELGPQPMVELAKAQMITQAAVTSIVDRLEELGLARRERSETDRRVVRVCNTKRGEEEVRKGMRLYKKFVERATQGMKSQELQELLSLLDRLLTDQE
ncbi:MAG TPA: MarR family transcriptional regulator [Candidatus Acidoferrales bacterium]|nr:MarR family transcriptional regulator [Candidatus Acidoferrales bacterium]